MRYSYQRGIHNTWRDHLQTVFDHVRSHNWLPVAIGSITALWLALILVDIQQKPTSLGSPSQLGNQKASHSLSVSYTSNGNDSVNAHESSNVTASVSASKPPAAPVQGNTPPATDDQSGADSSTPETAAPPATDTSTTTSSSPSGGDDQSTGGTGDQGSGDNGSDDGITVTTPITGPVTVEVPDPTTPGL